MRRLAIAFVAASLAGGVFAGTWAVRAADGAGNFAVKGVGLERCERFTAERAANSQTYWYFLSWLNGYLSAYNQYVPETYDITPRTSIANLASAFDVYCRQNPDRTFLEGAISLTQAVAARRMQTRPAVVAQRPAALSREAVRRGQQALQDKGLYTGAIDGIMGPGTGEALKAFQRSQNLDETGVFDPPTLARLLQR